MTPADAKDLLRPFFKRKQNSKQINKHKKKKPQHP